MLDDPRLRYTDRFSLLESQELVSRAFEEIHSRQIAADKAKEIVSHVSQARAYFAAASESDELVRPLLQYYGTLGTARSLILLKSPSLREAALAPSHGLSAIGWKQHFASGGDWLEARLRIEGGTFTQLAEVTKNARRLRIHRLGAEDLAVEVAGSSGYPPSFEFRVSDVISRLPRLRELFEAIVQLPSETWWCKIFDRGSSYHIEVIANARGLPTEEQVRDLFDLDDAVSVGKGSILVSGWGATDTLEFLLECEPETFADHLTHIVGDNHSLLLPLTKQVIMSELSLVFAAAYGLGMLVRYFPTHWMSLITRGTDDGLLPLIRALSSATQDFPALAIEHL